MRHLEPAKQVGAQSEISDAGKRASLVRKLIDEQKTAKVKLREARRLILLLRADLEAKRVICSTICQMCKGGVDHLPPTDAVRIKAIHELSSQGARHNHETGMFARSLPSEVKNGIAFPSLTANPRAPSESSTGGTHELSEKAEKGETNE